MRTLLTIGLAVLTLGASGAPALAQSYARAIDPLDGRQSYREPDDRGGRDDGYREPDAYAQRDDNSGRGDESDRASYSDRGRTPNSYGRQDAYRPADDYRPAPRRRHRPSQGAAISRYDGYGRPLFYDDGMIRSGRDWPAGTVGTQHYAPSAQVPRSFTHHRAPRASFSKAWDDPAQTRPQRSHLASFQIIASRPASGSQ